MVDEGVKFTTVPLVAVFCSPFGALPYCNFTTRPVCPTNTRVIHVRRGDFFFGNELIGIQSAFWFLATFAIHC
jgi:hypothetical protein